MSKGEIPASIRAIVEDLPDIEWEQVLFEAVTNSLQANALNIKIYFVHNALDLKDTKKYIDRIVVEDDGDGFNKENTESFKKYRTDYKKDKFGCKGIGRFLYLKIFRKIHIESLDKEINFVVDRNIEVATSKEKHDKTKIYFNESEKNFVVDFEILKQKLKDHFIAYFKLLNDSDKKINISIYENDTKKFELNSHEIPDFKTTKFKVHTHEFILDYVINENGIKEYDGFYCAGGRVVVKNSLLDTKRKFSNFKNINILYLLSSKYLDNNVNQTRDNFNIMPTLTHDSLYGDLSWKDIHSEMSNKIKEIAKELGIDIDKFAKESLQKAIEEAPFLAYYLQENDNGLDNESLVRSAKKQLEEDKKLLREKTNAKDEEYHKKLGIVTQAELAEYIFDRQKTIEKLKSLTNETALEKEVHNLFMERYTSDDKQNYKSNNLWLFDDRFMAYDKIFSEAQIKEIFPELSAEYRPDILSIASNTLDKETITDIVLIELKRPDEKITPAIAQQELRNYADLVNQSRQYNKIRIWAYAFLKFNEQTERDLRLDDYNKIPTHSKYPIYYKYNQTTNTIINFLDYHSLACDAETRNKTFIDILLGKSLVK